MEHSVQAPQEQLADQGYQASVIVANDDSFPMEAVLNAFCKVLPGMDPDRAHRLMMEIHSHGLAEVWSGPREVCELYCEQLSGLGLKARVI